MAQPIMDLDLRKREILFSRIIEILEEMPEKLRDVFILTHYEGKESDEIVSRLGITESELEGLLNQANQTFYRTLRNF